MCMQTVDIAFVCNWIPESTNDLCIHDHQRATPHWENNPTSHLIYYHSKHYIEEFVVLIASLKPYLIEHQVILLNCGVIWS